MAPRKELPATRGRTLSLSSSLSRTIVAASGRFVIGYHGLLQHLEHRGGVLIAEAHFHRCCVDRLRQGEQRCLAADLVGKFGDDRHVLFPGRDLHGGGLVAAFDHHGRAHLEHPRTAGTGAAGPGRLVMMMSVSRASCLTSAAMATPAEASSAPFARSMSLPSTVHPRSTRLRAIAPPMMPSPTIPTVLFMRSCPALSPPRPRLE